MEFDPHTINEILSRIRQQMRCPQCGSVVPIEFASVRLTGEDFVLLQLKCKSCDAYIVLHASLTGLKAGKLTMIDEGRINASTAIHKKENDVEEIRSVLEQDGVSFEKMFKEKK